MEFTVAVRTLRRRINEAEPRWGTFAVLLVLTFLSAGTLILGLAAYFSFNFPLIALGLGLVGAGPLAASVVILRHWGEMIWWRRMVAVIGASASVGLAITLARIGISIWGKLHAV